MPTKTKRQTAEAVVPQPVAAAAVATSEAAADIADLAALVAAIGRLPRRTPVERARQAKALMVAAQRLLADAHREAVYEATRERTYDEVAEELGVSKPAIALAVGQHRRAMTRGVAS